VSQQDPRTIPSRSVDDTMAIGRAIGSGLRGGDVLGLVGPLGAGKTQLVKGIAAGLGAADLRKVTSPTFVLVNEYQGRLLLFHVDAYRLAGGRELEAIGFDELCSREGAAVVVEWADRVADLLPERRLQVRIEVTGPTQRRLTFQATGGAGAGVLASVDSLRAG
jgi:tRNA threonylcarbamoyladenosine biosynthesis protein TsaE